MRRTNGLIVMVVVVGVLALGERSTVAAVHGACTDHAKEIVGSSGVQGGLVVHVGCGNGKLTAELLLSNKYLIQGLDTDPEQVAAARKHIHSRGKYGQVSVRQFDGRCLPYAGNSVNLLIISRPFSIDRDEIHRVLRPGGVVMFLDGENGAARNKVAKPWPDEIDDWSHWRHGPDANPVAKDRIVDTPRHIQWVDTPRWQTHHNTTPSLNAMVSGGGRMFYIVNEAEAGIRGLPGKWRLVSRDAFNGVLLWKRKVPQWGWKQWSHRQMAGRFNKPIHLSRRLVAGDDHVYATLGGADTRRSPCPPNSSGNG